MWKRKLGSSGTYNKLIEVFERAGYKSYADNVIKVMSESLGEIEMSIGKYIHVMVRTLKRQIYM